MHKDPDDDVPFWMKWLALIGLLAGIGMWANFLLACTHPEAREPRKARTPWQVCGEYKKEVLCLRLTTEKNCNAWREFVLGTSLDAAVGSCKYIP